MPTIAGSAILKIYNKKVLPTAVPAGMAKTLITAMATDSLMPNSDNETEGITDFIKKITQMRIMPNVQLPV